MTTIKIALDWTPNTNHSPFYVAIKNGWYNEAGLQVEILPLSDDYKTDETPARRVVNGVANLCVAPTESVISCWTSEEGKVKPIAVATLIQDSSSAIVTLKSSGITSPKGLDGKKYASYAGRFEMKIVEQLIKNAGGQGTVQEIIPPKLACFDEVVSGACDSTWVFMDWEVIDGQVNKGVELNTFYLKDYDVPYGYSPLLLAHPDLLALEGGDALRRFLKVTERAAKFASEQPEETAKILVEASGHHSLREKGLPFVTKAQQAIAGRYLDKDGRWGRMQADRWTAFVDFLCENKCLSYRSGDLVPRSALDVNSLFTTKYLD